MKETTLNNKNVLLEALEYIDRDLIAETVEELKAPPMRQATERDKSVTRKSIKYALLLAACLVLVSAIIPVVNYVLTHFDIFPGGLGSDNSSEETTDTNTEKENIITPIYEHDKKAPYPIFATDLEPITEDMIEKVKEAWYQKVYSFEYNTLKEYYANSNLSENDKEKNTITAAKSSAEYYSNILFSKQAQDHYIGRYYGIKENCVIFAINTHLAGEYNVITISDIQIQNNNSFYILVYKDGEIKTLEDAYSTKWLTYNSIERIEVRHRLFNSFAYWKKAVYTIYNYAKFALELENIAYESIESINDILLEKGYIERFTSYVEKDQTYKNMYDIRISREKLADKAYSGAKSEADAFVLEKGEDKVSQEESCRYYGTFGEKIIWADYSDLNAITEFTLAGYNFFFANTTNVNVYVNGNILPLTNAYSQGLLTDTEITKLYERYLAYEEYLDMMRVIGDRIGDALVYGKYDGAIVFGQESMMALYNEESVAGCIFRYSNGVGIKVYKNGELYGLYNAYNSGILSDEQIKDIWRKHEINVRKEDANFEDNYIYGDYLNPIKGLEPLTKTGIDEANAEWAALYPEHVGKLIDTDKINRGLNYRYLGTVAAYTVFWIAGSGEAETKNIQGYEFSYSSEFDILLVHSDSSFLFIEEGPSHGFYESRIAIIYERNKEYEEYFASHEKNEADPVDIPKPTYPKFTPDLEDLTRQQMFNIRDAYANYCWKLVKDSIDITQEQASAISDDAWGDLFSADIAKFKYFGIIDNKAVFAISNSQYGKPTGIMLNGLFVYSFDKRKFTELCLNPLTEEGAALLAQRVEEYNKYLSNWQLNQ